MTDGFHSSHLIISSDLDQDTGWDKEVQLSKMPLRRNTHCLCVFPKGASFTRCDIKDSSFQI